MPHCLLIKAVSSPALPYSCLHIAHRLQLHFTQPDTVPPAEMPENGVMSGTAAKSDGQQQDLQATGAATISNF